jgi:hypothetical protein
MKAFPLIVTAFILTTACPVRAGVVATAGEFSSVRVYPNPWRADKDGSSQTMIFDDLPPSVVTTLRIYTIAGEHVRTESGVQRIPWDLRNGSGQRVASGVYLYILSTSNQQKTGKVAVIR